MIEDKPGRPSNDAAATINGFGVGAYAVPFPEPGLAPEPVILYAVAPYYPPVPGAWVMTITPEMIRQIIREELERLLPKRKRR